MSAHFYTPKDIQKLLGTGSIRTAQLRIQVMNEELKALGFWVERGKIPKKFFHQKFPYIEEGAEPHDG